MTPRSKGSHACRSSGTEASGGINSLKSAGMTPMTVVGVPLTRICLPMMVGSPPYRRCHTACVSRIAAGAFSIASSGAKTRPSAGSAPSTEKKSVVTNPMRSCSGSGSPSSDAVFDQIAPKPENSVPRSRRSFSSGPESGARGYPESVRSHQTKTSRDESRNGSGAISIA